MRVMKTEYRWDSQDLDDWFRDLEEFMANDTEPAGDVPADLELSTITDLIPVTDSGTMGQSSSGVEQWDPAAYLNTPPQQPSWDPMLDFDFDLAEQMNELDQNPEFQRILDSLLETEAESWTQPSLDVAFTPPWSTVSDGEQATNSSDTKEVAPPATTEQPSLPVKAEILQEEEQKVSPSPETLKEEAKGTALGSPEDKATLGSHEDNATLGSPEDKVTLGPQEDDATLGSPEDKATLFCHEVVSWEQIEQEWPSSPVSLPLVAKEEDLKAPPYQDTLTRATIEEPMTDDCHPSSPVATCPTTDKEEEEHVPPVKKSKVDMDGKVQQYAFPLRRVHDDLQEILNAHKIQPGASKYMGGVLESVVRDTLEKILEWKGGRDTCRLESRDVVLAMDRDECLRKLTRDVVIPVGGMQAPSVKIRSTRKKPSQGSRR